jgi:L-ascorbate metabolism protein UlaG (beta-lactamase superfamily)
VPEPADVVVISSATDPAHSCWQQVPGTPRVVNALDAVEAPVDLGGGVALRAVLASEGFDREDPRQNAIYWLELDGVCVCHLGDVGNPLSEEQLAPLRGRVDCLLALAGGGQTIPLADLDRALDEIAPRLVVPMHYRTPRIRYELGPVEDFLDRHAGEPIERSGSSALEVTRDTLPGRRTIVVLEPLFG